MRKTKTSLTPSEQPSHCQDLVDVDKEILGATDGLDGGNVKDIQRGVYSMDCWSQRRQPLAG
jgi:hypothetical protein